MKPFLIFLRIEIAMFLRERTSLFWTLAFPLFMLIIQMALFGRGASLSSLKVAIVDFDRSSASVDFENFVKRGFGHLSATTDLRISIPAKTEHYDLTVEIPAGYAATVRSGRRAEVAATKGSGPTAAMATGVLQALIDEFNLAAAAAPRVVAMSLVASEAAPANSYTLYVITGLSVMIILSTSLMGFAGPIVSARESGLFRLYQLFPVSSVEVLAAWWLARILIIMLSISILFLVAQIFYHIPIAFSVTNVALGGSALVFGAAAALSIGLVIASLAPDLPAVSIVCNILYFPLILCGNLLLPTSGLPAVVRRISDIFPVNALAASVRRCLIGQPDFNLEGKMFLQMAVIIGICLAVAHKRFRWVPQR